MEEKKILTGEELLDSWFKHEVKTDICNCDDCKEIQNHVIECPSCGYKGKGFFTLECCCYDEWAGCCTAKSPGPGCPHGTPICPVCEDGDYIFASSFKDIRELLKTKKYQEL